MAIRIKKGTSAINTYSIEATSAIPTQARSICITWNQEGGASSLSAPLVAGGMPSEGSALSASEVTRGPSASDAHLVVSRPIFEAIVTAINALLVLTISITNGAPGSFSITCAAPLEDGDPDLRLLLETAKATGQTVKSIDGHLVEIKGLLVDFINSQRPPAKPSANNIEFVRSS